MLTSCAATITDFTVCEPDVNFSDHLLIMSTIVCRQCFPSNSNSNAKCNNLLVLNCDGTRQISSLITHTQVQVYIQFWKMLTE